jgi:hypothetical protein
MPHASEHEVQDKAAGVGTSYRIAAEVFGVSDCLIYLLMERYICRKEHDRQAELQLLFVHNTSKGREKTLCCFSIY